MQVMYGSKNALSNIPILCTLFTYFLHCFLTELTPGSCSRLPGGPCTFFLTGATIFDTPPQGLDGNPIKVDMCRRNVNLSAPFVKMSAA